jgi:hypothetical protein
VGVISLWISVLCGSKIGFDWRFFDFCFAVAAPGCQLETAAICLLVAIPALDIARRVVGIGRMISLSY